MRCLRLGSGRLWRGKLVMVVRRWSVKRNLGRWGDFLVDEEWFFEI